MKTMSHYAKQYLEYITDSKVLSFKKYEKHLEEKTLPYYNRSKPILAMYLGVSYNKDYINKLEDKFPNIYNLYYEFLEYFHKDGKGFTKELKDCEYEFGSYEYQFYKAWFTCWNNMLLDDPHYKTWQAHDYMKIVNKSYIKIPEDDIRKLIGDQDLKYKVWDKFHNDYFFTTSKRSDAAKIFLVSSKLMKQVKNKERLLKDKVDLKDFDEEELYKENNM